MSMLEELAAAKAAKKPSMLDQLNAAKAAKVEPAVTEPPVDAVEPEQEADWLGRANAALQGMTFGFADEIGTGAAAALVKAMGALRGEETDDYGNIYDDMMQAEQVKRDAYTEANPAEALGLNVAGGLATGGASVAKLLPALKGPLMKTLGVLGVGGTEGGIAGAGSAPQGERLEGALEGAAWGAGSAGALKGAGKAAKGALNKATKRRIANDLVDEAGEFTPINVADSEGVLGDFYRNTVGRAAGSGKLTDQTKAVIQRAEDEVASSDKEMVRRIFGESAPDGFDVSTLDIDDPDKVFKTLNDQWKKNAFGSIKDSSFVIDDDDLITNVMNQIDDPALRDQGASIRSSLKHYLSPNIKREMTPPPKEQAFRKKGVGVEPVPSTPSSRGEIEGEELLNARNKLRMQINAAGNEPKDRLMKAAYSKAVEEIDKVIRPQLSDEALRSFDADLSNYKKFNVLADAKAKGAVAGDDAFTAKQLLNAATSGKGRLAAEGEAAFQQPAKAEVNRNAALTAAAKHAKSRLPPETSAPQKVASTAILGSPVTLATGLTTPLAGLAVPSGYATAKTLSRPNVQRVLAGQTKPQEALAEALRRYETGDIKDILRDMTSGARRGYITNNEQE